VEGCKLNFVDDLFAFGYFLHFLLLFYNGYSLLLLLDLSWHRLKSFNFFLRFIPFNRLRFHLLPFITFLNRCPFLHDSFGLLLIYFLHTSLLRPEHLLSAGSHGTLGDFSCDFISISRRYVCGSRILDGPLVSIGSGDGRLLLYHYFRQFRFKLGADFTLLDFYDFLSSLDVTHQGINFVLNRQRRWLFFLGEVLYVFLGVDLKDALLRLIDHPLQC
jgi:hypothetical protein